ncbi:MAG: TPM domain-containing protein, partial [Carnobacterium sp.]|uniref:TPM domain-containing protein n=1 Tax=Carnobacterium sp. TaxID=48221 RepID=UPI00331605BD
MQHSDYKQFSTIWIVFIALFSFLYIHPQLVAAAELPETPSNFYYYDEPGILTPETKELILTINEHYEQTAEKPQIVVAVIDSLNGETVEDYSVALFEKWKIGNIDYDNGVLILLAIEEREIRIEVGYGLEGALTDGKTGKILDDNLAYLSNNLFDGGLQEIF